MRDPRSVPWGKRAMKMTRLSWGSKIPCSDSTELAEVLLQGTSLISAGMVQGH